ncbi:hypothetical protein K469DRAFT_688356 [Zopfia rhizophila CBS 207.26]|uniref:Uncharacterized protein n=1 Tax=Zopfia rhizophila CBS 207.26 TaxID=1314779 RepID=A0A6A6D7T1_9PEZI|nr:hypothetical protein K469DRAFT_688356 [Zopfia rhizophila CBS 207.26]
MDSAHWFKDLVAIKGCKRGGEKNHISALVCVKQLQEALNEVDLEPDALMKWSNNGYFLALRFSKRDSLQHYSSPKDAPPGEVFRMIRMCQIHQRPDEEQWWWRGISNTITKDVKQLLSKKVIMKEVDCMFQGSGYP